MAVIDKIAAKANDIHGNHTETLLNGVKTAGYYNVTWNADSHPTGIYFIQFRSGYVIKTMKVILIK